MTKLYTNECNWNGKTLEERSEITTALDRIKIISVRGISKNEIFAIIWFPVGTESSLSERIHNTQKSNTKITKDKKIRQKINKKKQNE